MMHSRATRLIERSILGWMIVLTTSWLWGCSSFGPSRLPPDLFDYNGAIAESSQEQMLMNLVRLRYQDVPVFLSVSSVLSQYVYSGNASVNGMAGRAGGASNDAIGAHAGVLYIDRPTVTYSPLSGEDFARQLLTPIPTELLFSLVQSEWPAKQLLTMSIQRINHLVNEGYYPAPVPAVGDETDSFRRAVALIIELSIDSAIEMQRGVDGDSSSNYLVFEKTDDPRTRARIVELKHMLNLAGDVDRFEVTDRITQRTSDQVTIRLRSLLTLMGYLSKGVQVPPSHLEDGWVPAVGDQTGATFVDPGLSELDMRVLVSEQPPEDTFVAVRSPGRAYQGPMTSSLTLPCPASIKPSCFAAALDKSIIRPFAKGPRSLITTSTDCPVFR